DRPFDPQHHPWEKPASGPDDRPQDAAPAAPTGPTAASQAAGHKPGSEPARTVVTAACAGTVAAAEPVGESVFLDFAHLKRQLSLVRVLEHLGLSSRLRGSGPQRRCACPIHRADGRGRTFSVNLDDNVFRCFDARCGRQGDVIDLWAALYQLSLR